MTVLYQHPEYLDREKDLLKLKTLYEGEHDRVAVPEYLWPYDLELTAEAKARKFYESRARRSRYTNLVALLSEIWSGLLFRKDPIIDEPTLAMLNDEERDIDGAGNTLTTFIKDFASLHDLIYGRFAIVVDAFKTTARTERERQEQGLRPYLQLVPAIDIVDWQRETANPARLNRLNFIRYEWVQIEPRASSADQPHVRRWSKEYVYSEGEVVVNIYAQEEQEENIREVNQREVTTGQQSDWALVESVPLTQLDEIPVVLHEGNSWIAPVVDLALRHYNLESALDNINYYAGNPLRYFTGFDAGAEGSQFAISEFNAVFLPDGATAGILEPTEPIALQKRILETRDQFFKIGLKQASSLPGDSRAAQTVESKREDKDNLVAIVQSRQENLEQTINQALYHYGRFKSVEVMPEVALQYDITEQDLTQTIYVYNAVRPELEQAPTVKREMTKSIIMGTGIEFSEEAIAELNTAQFRAPEPQGELAALFNGE